LPDSNIEDKGMTMDVMQREWAHSPEFKEFLGSLNSSAFLKGSLASVDVLYRKYGDDYVRLAETMLASMRKMGVDPTKVFEAYIYQYIRDLVSFQKTGEYNNGTFDEIKDKIYDNEELMSETYLPGLFVAYGFTSLLHEKYRFFERAFLSRLRPGMNGTEVGFGDGFYLWNILNSFPDISVSGFDISEHALKFSKRLFEVSNISSARYQLRLGNLNDKLPVTDGAYDWCILTEVIEHVADPVLSLKELNRIMKPGATFFMTTVMDSNHMDHITNFESSDEVAKLLGSAGFVVQDQMEHALSAEVQTNDKSVGLAFVSTRV
jgi:2-polyprenyl-3-methyl-5-hydroxy-6-metoxy-1,4-benzoquinol methylase